MNGNYWPTQDWRGADPESVGMRAESLSHLEREIQARYRSISAFLVVRGGYLVFERYFGGCGQGDKHLVASVTKSFISALIGIAIDQGFIEGVHQKSPGLFSRVPPRRARPPEATDNDQTPAYNDSWIPVAYRHASP